MDPLQSCGVLQNEESKTQEQPGESTDLPPLYGLQTAGILLRAIRIPHRIDGRFSLIPLLQVLPDGVDERAIFLYVHLVVLYTLNMMGFLVTGPLLVFAQTKFFNDNKDCVTDEQTKSSGCVKAMEKNAQCQALQSSIFLALSFTISPVIGRLSDSIGRRRCIAYAMVPMVVRQLFLFLWALTGGAVSLWPFFMMGGVPDFVWIVGSAFVADIMPSAARGAFFAFNSALFSINTFWGASLAEYLSHKPHKMLITSAVALASRSLCLFMAIWVLPETIKRVDVKPFNYRDKAELRKMINGIAQMKILNRSAIFRRLAVTLLLTSTVGAGVWQVQSQYQRQVLLFSVDENVRLLQIGSAGGLFVNMIITPIMLARVGEKRTIIIGLFVYLIYLLAYAAYFVQPHKPWTAYIASLIQDVANVNYPAISSIKSTLCTGDEQGQVLGSISAVQALGFGIGPVLFNFAFEYALKGDKPPSTLKHKEAVQSFFGVLDIYWLAMVLFCVAVGLAFTVPDPAKSRVREQRSGLVEMATRAK